MYCSYKLHYIMRTDERNVLYICINICIYYIAFPQLAFFLTDAFHYNVTFIFIRMIQLYCCKTYTARPLRLFQRILLLLFSVFTVRALFTYAEVTRRISATIVSTHRASCQLCGNNNILSIKFNHETIRHLYSYLQLPTQRNHVPII